MATTAYTVQGMTCEHCVRAVTTELVMVAGVQSVDVDLSSGVVTVTSGAPLDADQVRDAIDEAGYTLA